MGFYSGIPAGDSFLKDLVLRSGIALPMLLGIFSGILAFFTGSASIFKQKERAILVLISTILGFLLLLFIIGEFIPPYH